MVSAVLLVTFWMAVWTVDLGSPRSLGLLTTWFLIAAYLQFFTTSFIASTSGLVLQAILAAYLTIRVKGQS